MLVREPGNQSLPPVVLVRNSENVRNDALTRQSAPYVASTSGRPEKLKFNASESVCGGTRILAPSD